MNDQQRVIQRLWYTAPPGEGFRTCALTDGLQEDQYRGGAQIRALERYTSYDPPDGTARDDASIFVETPDLELMMHTDAPISLSLIEIRNPEVLNSQTLALQLRGRVLVNKMYLGKGGTSNREGNVFIDLLANLPDGFTAYEALALWRATDFWQQRYDPAYVKAIKHLSPVELPTALLQAAYKHSSHISHGSWQIPLRNPFAQVSLRPETERQLIELLTFLIHAYLLQQHDEWPIKYSWQIKRQRAWQDLETLKKNRASAGKIKEKEREYKQLTEQYHLAQQRFKRIYVAVEDDRLAYCLTLLARLFQNIPSLLLPLTFSTYEHTQDILESECMIIGTSPSRSDEHEGKSLDKLLPLECDKRGYVYNTYYPVRNTQLPLYLHGAEQRRLEPIRIEAVARYLARKLMQPGERFATYLQEVAEQIAATSGDIPAQLFISLWQPMLIITDLLKKPYLLRSEVTRLLQDQEWWEFLEEPEISRQVFQWVIADCKGLDLEQPAANRTRHPQIEGIWQQQCSPDAHTLPEQIKQSIGQQLSTTSGKAVAASLAKDLRILLEEYADNLAQPAMYGLEPDSAWHMPIESEHPCFDVITAYKQARDPEPFWVLLNVLRSCGRPMQGVPAWTGLLRYLFSTRLARGQQTFVHAPAASFVLRHLYDQKLASEIAKQHWHIHFTLLNLANQVLPEHVPDDQLASTATPLELITPLLLVPLRDYWFLYGDDSTRQRWHVSWRKEALIYQINQLQSDESLNRFNGQHWETLRISARNQQESYDFIKSHWQTYYLLLSEALDCLDEWEHALPLLDEQSPPFQPELLQQFEPLPQVTRIQQVIWQQAETGQPDNKEAAILFYWKLIQGDYTPAHILLLLDTWHQSWKRGSITNEELHSILERTTNLSQDALRQLLLTYKEDYKRSKAEAVLAYLYNRYLQQIEIETRQAPGHSHAQLAKEEAASQMLFQLLEGELVSQAALDELLHFANMVHLRKVEFFVRCAPAYLPAYFKQEPPKRSKEFLQLFLKLIAEDQAQQNQTLRPGQPSPGEWRKVILAIFWLWLCASGDDEIVDLLFTRLNPQPVEMLYVLATFGGAYMTTSKSTLKASCQNHFKKLCGEYKLEPAWKLLLCLNLLPPESFPFMSKALSVTDVLAIFQAAALTPIATPSYLTKRPLMAHVRLLLAQQEQQPEIQVQALVEFLRHYGCKADGLSQHLEIFLKQETRRVHELVRDVEMFMHIQGYRSSYAASELELFLEIQEYRVKGNYPPETLPIPQAVYLRYAQSDKNQAEPAEPFKQAYLSYLREFSNEDFERRQGSLVLLKILGGAGAVDKSIDWLANGWLAVRDFLQTCQGFLEPSDTSGEEDAGLSNPALRDLEQALQQIQQAGLRPERYQQLVNTLIFAIAPCVSDQSDVLRVCKLGPVLSGIQKKNPEFALLLQLSQQASAYYRKPERLQMLPEWFAPYLETLPLLKKDFGIVRDVTSRRYDIMQALLFVNNEPEEQTLLALDTYLQRAADGKLLGKVVALWEEYKNEEPRIRLILSTARKGSHAEEHKETLPVSVVIDTQTPPSVPPGIEQEQALRPRIPWRESLNTVYQMRKAIRRADRQGMQNLWADLQTRHILSLHQRQIGRTYWQRFQELRQLDDAYRDLRAASIASPDFQKHEDSFFTCAGTCLKREKRKWGWRKSFLPEQKAKYKEIFQRRSGLPSNKPAGK